MFDRTIEAARISTTSDTAEPQDDLGAAKGIIRGFLWSLPVWVAICWWVFT